MPNLFSILVALMRASRHDEESIRCDHCWGGCRLEEPSDRFESVRESFVFSGLEGVTVNQSYDVVVIGSGSVGVPAAWAMARSGLNVLVVDKLASPGQGSNKAAIGGIRATHSEPAKIRICLRSLEIASTWRETHGDDIEWQMGGYSFVAYGAVSYTHLTLPTILLV